MHTLIFKKVAEKFLKKLDKENQNRILKKLKQLKNNPELGKPLIGNLSGLWALRIGKYRILYQIFKDKLIIVILDIGHRKNIY
mgnify:CR=1 FL=1|jgi:mRNA interferase RelE/StbE